jgi:hypothetical protein
VSDIGLSDAQPASPRTLFGRIAGVVTAPRAVYAEVVARPRWAGVFLVVAAVSAAGLLLFLSTATGQDALVEQQLQLADSFGIAVSDAGYAHLQQIAASAAWYGAAIEVVALLAGLFVLSAVAMAVFNGRLGGRATFRQLLAVVAHSGVILGLQQAVTLPLDYARQTLSSPFSLGALAPIFDDGSFPARLLGSIDLFRVWWLLSLATGLAVLYRRRPLRVAGALLAVYAVIALAIAALQASLSGG